MGPFSALTSREKSLMPNIILIPMFQTDQELDVTKTRQEKTEAKSTEAFQKAETERGHIKHELDTVKDALSNIK